jgi:hypothetical protein
MTNRHPAAVFGHFNEGADGILYAIEGITTGALIIR